MTTLHERTFQIPLIQRVAEFFCIPESDILGPSRSATVARARQVAMYLMRIETGASYTRIGRAFNRDHTTAIHAVRETGRRMERDAEFRDYVRILHRWAEPMAKTADPCWTL